MRKWFLGLPYKLGTDAAVGPLGRNNGYRFGVGGAIPSPALYQDLDYKYSDSGHFVAVCQLDRGDKFQYAYVANSALVDTVSHIKTDSTVDWTVNNAYEEHRDLLVATAGKWGANTHTQFEYAYDDRRQRSTVIQRKGAAYDDLAEDIHRVFGYNGRGELVQAYDYLGGVASDRSAPMSGRLFDYDYDGIGNRRSSNSSGVPDLRDEYTTNTLNQYTARENNTMAIGGVADPGAKVVAGTDSRTVAGRTPGKLHWGDNILVNNANGAYYGDVRIYAVKPRTGLQDLLQTITAKGTLAPAWQVSQYDEEGNIISDGVWTYEWDAENRLRAMQTDKSGTTQGLPLRLEYLYDAQHRRVQKKIYNKVGSTWVVDPARERRYMYNGSSLIGEFCVSGANLVLVRSYIWGLDILRSLEGAGGVAALLQIKDHEAGSDICYYPSYDGNGNVTSLVNGSTGAVAAAYEYSPYGELLRCDGLFARKNPFRFSTKYVDDETGLIYYGTRYYDPRNGRFISKDPIREKGGQNLYAFVRNNPISYWDILGRTPGTNGVIDPQQWGPQYGVTVWIGAGTGVTFYDPPDDSDDADPCPMGDCYEIEEDSELLFKGTDVCIDEDNNGASGGARMSPFDLLSLSMNMFTDGASAVNKLNIWGKTDGGVDAYNKAKAEIIKSVPEASDIFKKFENYNGNTLMTLVINNKGINGFASAGMNKATLFWDPTAMVTRADGGVLSPDEVLAHEVDHAVSWMDDPVGFAKRVADKTDGDFGDAEEKRAISEGLEAAIRRSRNEAIGTTHKPKKCEN